MPVLLFAAQTELDLVRPLAARLRTDGGEVRCYLEEDDYDLRALGCKIAVGELDDAVTLEGALTGVHTFIPILPDWGGVRGEEELDRVWKISECASETAAATPVEQTILPLTDLPGVEGWFGEWFRKIQELFVSRVHPLLILKTAFLWGPERPLAKAVRKGAEDAGPHILSVIDVEEWVSAVAAADDLENIHGIRELKGRKVSIADLLRELVD